MLRTLKGQSPRNMKKLFTYIAVSWEGPDGKFSYKRASQFVFIFLLSWLVLKDKIETPYGFYSLVVLCATFLLLAKIITPKELIELKNFKAEINAEPNI